MANPEAGGDQTLDLARQNELFEHATPEEILTWTTSRFAPDAVLTMSFQHEGVVRTAEFTATAGPASKTAAPDADHGTEQPGHGH